MNRKKITVVVPIRKGSQRILNKNFKPFAGKNLLAIKLDTLTKINVIDEIIVNTDSELALEIADEYGVGKFKRDPYFATSECNNSEFFQNMAQTTETDYLIREVRRLMADKFANYLRFVETLLNPVNAPMSIFSIVKTLKTEEKNKLTEIYKKLLRNEVDHLELEVSFSEEKEAKYIKESYETWLGIQKDFVDIIKTIKGNWDNKVEKNNKGYFG